MLFPSVPFIFYFLPITVILYLIAPKKLKNVVLLLMSLVFYAWGEQLLVIIFMLAIFAGWAIAILIEKSGNLKVRKLLLIFACCLYLGMLGYFKYTDFFIESINALTGASVPLLRIALPIGISFYTFQIMSYIVDVYRASVKAQHNIIDLAAYVSFFPQLIAGPIVRYADIEKQLTRRTHSFDKFAEGLSRFIVGLGKKVLIANALGELCNPYRTAGKPSVLFSWLYAIGFMLQIYFDFSAYSDMAIGLAKMFGFELIENFNYPYISDSITEFWRRWHISLGSWFRDYVYIPLGGNRKGKVRQIFNILVVWSLTGMWHGAAWNFIVWGFGYAVLLIIEKLWLLDKLKMHRIFAHIYVLFAVMLGFVVFNAASFTQAASDIAGLFSFGRLPFYNNESMYYLSSYALTIVAAVIGATPLPKKLWKRLRENRIIFCAEPVLLCFLLIIVTGYLVDGSFNPFLYFRF